MIPTQEDLLAASNWQWAKGTLHSVQSDISYLQVFMSRWIETETFCDRLYRKVIMLSGTTCTIFISVITGDGWHDAPDTTSEWHSQADMGQNILQPLDQAT
jgi:hypothetical protein